MRERVPDVLLSALTAPPEARRLWIAYSGGLDSHVLLHACAALQGRLRCELRAVHLDHGLHPDSAHWATHCRSVCAGLGMPLDVHRLGVDRQAGESLEAVARQARYQALADLLGPGEAVATAQHRDDQAETLLLALLRGSGVHGLAAMPARAALGEGWLLRPLLGLACDDLRAYAMRHRLDWIEDPSNADTELDRNLLRHRVLPLLRERWPAASTTLSRSAAHCAEAAALIDDSADERLPQLVGGRPGTLSVQGLRTLKPAQARAVLRRWLMAAGFGPPDRQRLARILDEVLPARADADPLVAWNCCEVRRYRDDLFALAPLPIMPPARTMGWDGTRALQLPLGLGQLEITEAGLPPPHDLKVRIGSRGEPPLRCIRSGAAGRSLKDLFQQAGIPPWLRAFVPVIERNGRLDVVAGVARCREEAAPVIWTGHPWMELGVFSDGVPPLAR